MKTITDTLTNAAHIAITKNKEYATIEDVIEAFDCAEVHDGYNDRAIGPDENVQEWTMRCVAQTLHYSRIGNKQTVDHKGIAEQIKNQK